MIVTDLSEVLASLQKFQAVAKIHEQETFWGESHDWEALTFITSKNVKITYGDICRVGRAFEIMNEITNNDGWQSV
jgi:hypothetical protein